MSRDDDFKRLVDRLYGAVAEPETWRGFWQDLARTMHASSATVIMQAPSAAGIDLQAGFAGGDKEGFDLYNQRFAALDPWFAAAASRGLSPTPRAFVGEQLVPLSDLRGSEFYAHFAKKFEMVRPLTIASTSPHLFAVSVLRSETGAPWSARDVAFVQTIEPHVRRAADLHTRLHSAALRSTALEDAFDRMAVGVIVLDARGCVLFANRAALTFDAARDGFALTREGPASPYRGVTAEMAGAIARTLRTDIGAPPAEAISLRRPSGKRPYALIVSAARLAATTQEGAAAILLITDPERRADGVGAMLCRDYGLTETEAAVSLALAGGQSISEIAAGRGVAIETVRSQVKTSMGKCGARRQSELVRLITTLSTAQP
ncbi:MAG: helix-turn-helix transcriptional regulator [Vicinamibacterales bacterium]|nr:helix-turn-helix transcriptional regulator [Vicinamibacterales bacterium]